MPVPKQKGIGLLPVVQGLKANPAAAAKVPPPLQHYLTDTILISHWYPEDDYHALIRVLADSVDPKLVGGDVWGFFGRVGAQRDIAGMQENVPRASRTAVAGVYRRFADGEKGDAASVFQHAVRLWSLYHDTGRMTLGRSPTDETVAITRLTGFRFPYRGVVDLQVAYFVEYARLRDLETEGRLVRSVDDGAPYYEWHYRVPRTPANVASLLTLPVAKK